MCSGRSEPIFRDFESALFTFLGLSRLSYLDGCFLLYPGTLLGPPHSSRRTTGWLFGRVATGVSGLCRRSLQHAFTLCVISLFSVW